MLRRSITAQFTAILVIVSVVVLINLIVDAFYALLDPRIRY